MKDHHPTKEVGQLDVALPAQAVENFPYQVGRISAPHNLTEAAMGRDSSFPCFKRSVWNDVVVVHMVHYQSPQPKPGN